METLPLSCAALVFILSCLLQKGDGAFPPVPTAVDFDVFVPKDTDNEINLRNLYAIPDGNEASFDIHVPQEHAIQDIEIVV